MAGVESSGGLPAIRVPTLPTFIGLACGLALGIASQHVSAMALLVAIAEPVGDLWLKALKMTILPLVAGLLFTGIAEIGAVARTGAMAWRTLLLFFGVLVASAAIGLLAMPALLMLFPVPVQGASLVLSGSFGRSTGPAPGLADFVSSAVPENIVAAAANGEILPFVIFIVLLALASTRLPEGQRDTLAAFFRALASAMLVVIGWVLALAPLGVAALSLGLAAKSGTGAITALGHYILLVGLTGLCIVILAYVLATLGGRLRPGNFASAVLPAQAVAVSTQSSLASLPAMLIASRRIGVRERNSEFVLPLSVALFRATSPAMNLAVAVYVAKLAGVEIGGMAMLSGAGVALLVSLGTVSLPGTISFIASVGPIAMAMGVPVELLAVLVAVEMLPDIVRTVGNVTMDVAVTAVVDRHSPAD